MVHGVMKVIKFLFGFVNLVLVCFAIGLIGLAANWRAEFIPINHFESLGITERAATALIIIGCILFVVSFLGSYGAFAENQCMLLTFAVIIFLFLIIEFVIAALFVTYGHYETHVNDAIRIQMEKFVKEYNNEDPKDPLNVPMDEIQKYLKCCGVYGPDDWEKNGTKFLPESCCQEEIQDGLRVSDLCKGGKYVSAVGCMNQAVTTLKDNVFIVGGTALLLALIELISISIAYCLSCAIRGSSGID